MSAIDRQGGCLCGAVRFTARIRPGILACHCKMCQRWTGGGPLLCVRAESVTFEGHPEMASYRASGWGERLFCPTCGSTLSWKMQDGPIRDIAVGLLDDQTGLGVHEEIFVDHRPGWLPAFAGASQGTEAEQMAKLAAHLGGDPT